MLGPVVFNISIDDLGTGIESAVSKLTDDTSWVSVDLLEGRRALQQHLARLDRWAKADGTRVSQTQRWVLDSGHNNPCIAAGGGAETGNQPSRKGCG